jgi:hypothetical protein
MRALDPRAGAIQYVTSRSPPIVKLPTVPTNSPSCGRARSGRGAWLGRHKKRSTLQGFSLCMFSRMATRAERDEILEQVRAGDRMVHRVPRGRATAHAAISVPQRRRSPQPLAR